jgi:hypothetical protein
LDCLGLDCTLHIHTYAQFELGLHASYRDRERFLYDPLPVICKKLVGIANNGATLLVITPWYSCQEFMGVRVMRRTIGVRT